MEPPRKRSITSFHSSSFFKNPYDSDSDNDTTQHSTRTPSDQQLQPTFYQPTNASLLDNSFKLFRPFSEEIDSAHHTFISPISDSEGFGAGRRDSMISIASSCTSDIGKDDEKSKSGSDDKSNDEDHFGQRRPTKPKKRSRATTEQLAVLEETFITNTSPNSKMREYLAEKVGMSERSIQIWFQNRRAKMKQGAKKAQAVQKEALKKPNFSGMYPFRIPLAPNHNGRLPLPPRQVQPNPNPAAFAAHAHAAAMAHQQRLAQAVPTRIAPGPNVSNCYPSPQPNTNSSSPSSFSVFPIQPPTNNGLRQLTNVKSNAPVAPTQHNPATILTPTVAPEAATNSTLSCDTLSVGSWRRVCLTPGDLQCLYNPIEKVFQWQVADNGVRFMMEFPYSAICSLEYQTLDANSGHLILDLKHAPTFFMMQVYSQPTIDGTESYVQKWVQCRDFTEGQQASRFFRHTLKGPAQALVAQIHVMKDSDEGLNKIWKPETSQGLLGTPLASNNMKFGTPHFGNRRRSAPVPDQCMLSDLTPSSNTLSPLDAAIAELSAGMNAQFFSNPSNSNPSSPFMIGMNQLPSSPANRGSAASENVNYLLQPTEMAAFAQMQQQRAIAQAHSALAKAKIDRSASVPEIQLQCNDLDDDDFLALLGQNMTSGPPPSSAPHDMQTPVYAYSQDDKNNNNTPSNDGFYHPGLQSLSTISDYSSVFQQSLTTPDMFESADFDQNAFDFSTSDFSSSNCNDFLSQSNSDNMFLEMSSPNPLVSVNTSNATLDLDRLDPTSVAAAAAFVDADFFAELMGTEGFAGLETGVLDC